MPGRKKRIGPPASTVEARENQLIDLAMDLAEEQLASGTASSQVITHFLKLASSREELEKEKLRRENLLLEAKADAVTSGRERDQIYAKALEAMRNYTGQSEREEDDD